jgi:hypothetical protein
LRSNGLTTSPQGERPQARRLRPTLLHQQERRKRFGPYFILKSLEQGPKFGVRVPKYPTDDPHYRIVTRQRSRYTHYYFYIRDEVLGPFVLCVGSFLPFQTTYYLNGHSFIACQLQRQGVRFRKDDNAIQHRGSFGSRRAPPGAPTTAESSRQGGITPIACLTLHPAINNFLTGGIREDLSEGLRNYLRANTSAQQQGDSLFRLVLAAAKCAVRIPPEFLNCRLR